MRVLARRVVAVLVFPIVLPHILLIKIQYPGRGLSVIKTTWDICMGRWKELDEMTRDGKMDQRSERGKEVRDDI